MAWNSFISHASENKDAVARPLADMFVANGMKVWCDTLWQACGLKRSFDFDQNGKCRERRR